MTTPPTIIKVALDTVLRFPLDYLAPENCTLDQLQPGVRIRVPFRNNEAIGILCGTATSSDLPVKKLKRAINIIDESPLLSEEIINLVRFASDYYHHPIGEVLSAAQPKLIRQGRSATLSAKAHAYFEAQKEIAFQPKMQNEEPLTLNEQQKIAVETCIEHLHQFKSFLLHGVTGSGKTEVYLQVIAEVLKNNQQALILVPEISLTPQTVARFKDRFAVPLALLHSNLTDRERLDAWLAAKEGVASLVIGTRSAIFTPMPRLGIIIIDEEHDASFKQQDGFRYSARDLAILRAKHASIPIILGSATPSLESQYNVERDRYALLTLPERAGNAVLPQFRIIDLRNLRVENGLSEPLLQHMRQHLDNNGQVLLFLNRRGFAPSLVCHSCGWVASCHRCDAHMTLHQTVNKLHCHHCDGARLIDAHCPQCSSHQLFPLGLGTERIEHALQQHFTDIGIIRIDRDSARKKGALNTMLEDIKSGKSRILIGTQMLAKGHHFPNVTLVAIINVDAGFFSADMRASERMGQLIIQVAGRAGRADKRGEVIIQTYHPNQPLLTYLIAQNFQAFSEVLLAERKKATCPPYTYHTLIRAEATAKGDALNFLMLVRNLLQKSNRNKIWILGPIPSLMERKAGRYRAQLLLQTNQRAHLHQLIKQTIPQIEKLKQARKVRWSIDVDPIEMV